MRLLMIVVFLAFWSISFSQNGKVQPKKYPSLLWEISGKGLSGPSYLFGTMHVSNKMVFHLSDSFYLDLKRVQIVALETNPGNWQEDFSRYDMDPQGYYGSKWKNNSSPHDYLTINTLQFSSYDKMIEMALYSSPSIVNSFLYRNNSGSSADFEEDTYLDLHIFQAGRKLGKKICGLENFDESMKLMKQAYVDAAKDKNQKSKNYEVDDDYSYSKLEEAYRVGNLDLLDTINKLNSTSAAFDEKFLYRRNEIQAHSIDSILKAKATLFAGVGAAHLPGQRGVIELLRRMGYILRPVKMGEWDGKQKEEIEKIHVPVMFSNQTSNDSFFTVSLPGKLYSFNRSVGLNSQEQYADMVNGSYYMVTRIHTDAALRGHNEKMVASKIDSVIYENVPGKILNKKPINRNGYKGFDILNKTRRGDYQRYNIFVTPFEIIVFKMSGIEDYVKESKEADQFFNSIKLKEYKNEWRKFSPAFGGFEVIMPHEPLMVNDNNLEFMALDNITGTAYNVIRSDIHNYDFAEEDSFDLKLMEESFNASEFIEKLESKKQMVDNGYPVLEAKYKCKDGSIAMVKFIIQGPHYYTLVTHSRIENPFMSRFLNSFAIKPFIYPDAVKETDTMLHFSVLAPFPLEKNKKISLFAEELSNYTEMKGDDPITEYNNIFRNKVVANDLTGEKIYVSYFKPSRYYFKQDPEHITDTIHFKSESQVWVYRSRKKYSLPNKINVLEYVLGDPSSSRLVRGKLFSKNGIEYRLESEGDTLSSVSTFISDFFDSFMPADINSDSDIRTKKTKIFFADLFSSDSLLHKHALKNIDKLEFDSSDLDQLKSAIEGLNRKEKKYLSIKNDFIKQLSDIKTREATDYLKDIYYSAGDTIEFQYSVLETLLQQKNQYAYKVFSNILTSDPPVINIDRNNVTYARNKRKQFVLTTSNIKFFRYTDYDDNHKAEPFLDELSDSLQLTATIFKDILPLINIHDYEQPIMELTGTLVDSNMISAKDYESYQSKFVMEAKQKIRKQVINEKNKLIERSQMEVDGAIEEEKEETRDPGNNQLNLYATLLMPFWDKNTAVPVLINQLLSSSDNRLKYNTTILLLRNKKHVPDSLINYFAKMDGYRFELYSDLKKNGLLNQFPLQYNNQRDLAKSKLLSGNSDNSPDSVVFIDKLPVHYKDRTGYVYFFKCKHKREDNSWKLASVGILPSDPKKFEQENKNLVNEDEDYDFTDKSGIKINNTEPIKVQLEKALKKMEYSKRKSAALFYSDDNNSGFDFSRNFNFKE